MTRLTPIRESLGPKATWAEIVHQAYFNRVNLAAQGFHAVPHMSGFNWTTGEGQPFAYFSHGVAVSEVEVDVLTGDHTLRRTDILMDVGASLNPAIDVGQIEGAFMQGVGWCTMEELVYGDREHPWVRPGHLFTSGPGTYKIPSFNDIPLDFRISLLKDSPNPKAVHSSKAIGEPPLFLAATVFFALKDAIAAARAQQGLTGAFALASPATSERIRMAVRRGAGGKGKGGGGSTCMA
jgi:xanthine dehydrogenase/oxidase